MSDALTIEDIETLKPEIKNDFSGTRQLPILAAVVPGPKYEKAAFLDLSRAFY